MKRLILVAIFGAFLPVAILMTAVSINTFKEAAAMVVALVMAHIAGYVDGRFPE